MHQPICHFDELSVCNKSDGFFDPPTGIEPATTSLQEKRSTNWATEEYVEDIA